MLVLTQAPILPSKLLCEFTDRLENSGAVISFSGIVRARSSSGDVQKLELQTYSPMTENGIKQSITNAKEEWPLEACFVAHRYGSLVPGDTIVFVATASTHRRAAFEAADFLMDYLKTKAVFWKKEVTRTGHTWIEPRAEDYVDADRWNKDNLVS